jgi:hypothetical protein
MKTIVCVFTIPHGAEGDSLSADHLVYNFREGAFSTSGGPDDPGGDLWLRPDHVAVVSVDADGNVDSTS